MAGDIRAIVEAYLVGWQRAIMSLMNLSKAELDTLVSNYRRHKKTEEPIYMLEIEELAKRTGAGLVFQKSLEIIR